MYEDDLTNLFEKALKEGECGLIWRALSSHLPSASAEASSLFNDPYFVREFERFIERNRLSIGTANIRYKLRLWLSNLKANQKEKSVPKGKPIRRFKIPAI